MGLILVTPPALEPISVPEVKAHLRIEGTLEDPLLTRYIAAARQHLDGVDGILGRALMTQTWTWTLDAFCPVLLLPLSPVQSVESVKYLDVNNVQQTLDPLTYQVDTKSEPARLAPAYSSTWPCPRPAMNAVEITFVAGYGAAPSAVPSPIRLALLGIVGDFYEHRAEAVLFGAQGLNAGLPQWVSTMLASYRIVAA